MINDQSLKHESFHKPKQHYDRNQIHNSRTACVNKLNQDKQKGSLIIAHRIVYIVESINRKRPFSIDMKSIFLFEYVKNESLLATIWNINHDHLLLIACWPIRNVPNKRSWNVLFVRSQIHVKLVIAEWPAVCKQHRKRIKQWNWNNFYFIQFTFYMFRMVNLPTIKWNALQQSNETICEQWNIIGKSRTMGIKIYQNEIWKQKM